MWWGTLVISATWEAKGKGSLESRTAPSWRSAWATQQDTFINKGRREGGIEAGREKCRKEGEKK